MLVTPGGGGSLHRSSRNPNHQRVRRLLARRRLLVAGGAAVLRPEVREHRLARGHLLQARHVQRDVPGPGAVDPVVAPLAAAVAAPARRRRRFAEVEYAAVVGWPAPVQPGAARFQVAAAAGAVVDEPRRRRDLAERVAEPPCSPRRTVVERERAAPVPVERVGDRLLGVGADVVEVEAAGVAGVQLAEPGLLAGVALPWLLRSMCLSNLSYEATRHLHVQIYY
ncbi:hypothetical protein OsJ_29095 [Oryza sativa Japonica Group]|uniref:Uncharacterized protein n=1 Tax=Oryza sativa subsp. japonica TaxID=39947 RepID=B9G377_ORYSJ|nr:hypothetical protein OsJ_29095 [Oryza sativa Japonica Group]